jgi:predicted nucleic acid-binding protein
MTARTIMLDTNVVSELMRVDANPKVAGFVGEIASPLLSVVVLDELAYGVELLPTGAKKSRFTAMIEAIRAQFEGNFVPVEQDDARLSGELRARVERRGGELKMADAMIAATALRRSVRLATRNTKHFVDLGLDLVNPWML